MLDHPWYDLVRLVLYVLWGVMALLVIKLLITQSRWRHPLRGNGPMLWALLLLLLSTELARARNLHQAGPPYLPSLLATTAATLLITYWLWQQLELLPRWLRRPLRRRRGRRDAAAGTRDTGVHHTKPRTGDDRDTEQR